MKSSPPSQSTCIFFRANSIYKINKFDKRLVASRRASLRWFLILIVALLGLTWSQPSKAQSNGRHTIVCQVDSGTCSPQGGNAKASPLPSAASDAAQGALLYLNAPSEGG